MKRILMLCVLGGFGVSAAVGCGGESSPQDKCEDLLDTVCDRLTSCLPTLGTQADCVRELGTILPCSSAKKVTSSYDTCMDQLEATSCPVLFPVDSQSHQPELVLPSSCVGVIDTQGAARPYVPAERNLVRAVSSLGDP